MLNVLSQSLWTCGITNILEKINLLILTTDWKPCQLTATSQLANCVGEIIYKYINTSISVTIVSFSLAVSRRYAAAMFDFIQLFISFTLRQVVSGLPEKFFFYRQVFLGEFECFPRLASAVSSDLKFLDSRNLTCLQPMSNGLYYEP